jgi:DNA transformation protein
MAINQSQLDFIIDQLQGVGEFTHKRMFGGIGFFKDGIMFALLGNGIFNLRVDESNVEDYNAYGMKRFLATEEKKGLPYYEVPVDILEDKDKLTEWALVAFEAAVRNKKK